MNCYSEEDDLFYEILQKNLKNNINTNDFINMKLEFKEKETYTFVKEIIESNMGSSNINTEVADILSQLPANKIEDAFKVLLIHIKELQSIE